MRSLLFALLLPACTPLTGIGNEEDAPRLDGLRAGGTTGLLLSEIMDHPTAGYKYVEICNRSTRTIDLEQVALNRYANGNITPGSFALSGLLDSGDSLVIVGSSGAEAFEQEVGRAPSFTSSIVSGNGDDVYELTAAGETVDIFGEAGVDGSGLTWEYTDSVAHRAESVGVGSPSWIGSDWLIQDGTNGTPFSCGGPIPDPEPTPPPVVGSLLITEVMDHADQSSVKYVEICNRSGVSISLDGAELHRFTNGSVDAEIVALDPVVLAPGGAHVVVNGAGSDAYLDLYGRTPDQVSNVTNGNGDDAYALMQNGQMLDIFGAVGVDGTGLDWDYQDQVALRAGDVLAGGPLWSDAEWTLTAMGAASPGNCIGDPPPPPDDDGDGGDCPDADGDGYGDCIDCDDNNRDVHPGAAEACDGLDNNCDGFIPEGDADNNYDGQLDCEICDEEGLWFPTQNLYGVALSDYLQNFSAGANCGWNSSRRKINGRIDAHDGIVECVYTDTVAPARMATTTGNINIEHTWPQSLGASAWPAKCDMHHLYPADMNANSARSSHPFGVPDPYTTMWQSGESRRGRLNGEVVFEVPDAHKGNVARSLFYMSTTYDFYFEPAYKARMLEWHEQDPVDLEEIERTRRIAAEQGAVNPLVACPHLLERL